jgi:prepilin-type N-terminal cleavage/methylation domain-containing protein
MIKRIAAFSLIEILIVVVVIGVLATLAVPKLIRKSPETSWEYVVDELNNLVYFARQEAISKQKNHRIVFFVGEKESSAHVEIGEENPENTSETIFKPAYSYYYNPKYIFPKNISIAEVFLGKEELLKSNKNKTAYCYVIPHGLVQEILIHLTRREEDGTISKTTLKMAPFFGRFDLYKGFSKPQKKRY